MQFQRRLARLIILTVFTGILMLLLNFHSTNFRSLEKRLAVLYPKFRPKATIFKKHKTLLEGEYTRGTDLPIPSVILRPSAGIGNQLFMFASTYAIARKRNLTFHIQLTRETTDSNRKFKAKERKYVLDCFNLNSSVVSYIPTEKEIPSEHSFLFNEVDWFKNQLPSNKILIAGDYWESELFFREYKDEILHQLQLRKIPNRSFLNDMVRDIEESESVAVHVRRGDFVLRGALDRKLPITYQIRAMELMKLLIKKDSQLKYFIFSDSIEYVKTQFLRYNVSGVLGNSSSIIYVSNSNRTSVEEFYLMTICKHMITPNSTFSWWAAYLNKYLHKIVIAAFPKYKHGFYEMFGNGETRKYKELITWKYAYPKGWITLNPFENHYQSL